MTNVLTNEEIAEIRRVIDYLRNDGRNSLADRVERVLGNVECGFLIRSQISRSVIFDGVYSAIRSACRRKLPFTIISFSKLLEL